MIGPAGGASQRPLARAATAIGVSRIAAWLEAPWRGLDIPVLRPAALTQAAPGTITFLSRADADAVARLNEARSVACVTTEELAAELSCTAVIHAQPRLAFARVVAEFFSPAFAAGISPHATVSPEAALGAGVSIGAGSRVDSGVRIGDATIIGCNTVIAGDVVIGRHCIVKSNTTVGEPGFGFPLDESGVPIRFPHIGAVRIGDGVEIGANCTVVRAALEATVIADHVKTDDHVHIAHNCSIGARTLIAAGVVISGSVNIGEDVWIGPNSTIADYVSIGDKAFIGLGSVVTKSVAAGARMFGVPARVIKS